MILVFKVFAVIVVVVFRVVDLPWHGAVRDRDFGLRCGRGRLASKVEASQAERT